MGQFCQEHRFIQSTFEDEDKPFGEFEPAAPSIFQWQRRTGETATPGTGAAIDHTLYDAAGHYLFINSSQENLQQAEKAELSTKVFMPGKNMLNLVNLNLTLNKIANRFWRRQ